LIQQFGLRTASGLPVVADSVAQHYGAITKAEVENLRRFMDYVLLGLNPTTTDTAFPHDRLACLANNFLPESRKDELLPRTSYPYTPTGALRKWRGTGVNELEAGRARQSFVDNYLPQIAAGAPQFPLEFVFIAQAHLGEYDTTRGGFPIGRGGSGSLKNSFALPASQCFGHRTAYLPFATELPSFWRIDPQTAEQQVIKRLPPQLGAPGRIAFAGIVFSIGPAAAAVNPNQRSGDGTLTPIEVSIRSVALYEDPDLERLMHQFVLDSPAPSVLLTGLPPAIPSPAEVLLNKESAALLLLKSQGDVLGEQAWRQLATAQSRNDQAYYAKRDEFSIGARGISKRRATFDPGYLPFFPPGLQVNVNTDLTPDQLATFKQWSLARSNALPDRLVVRGEFRQDRKTGVVSLRLGSGEHTTNALTQALIQQGYVPGQIVLPDGLGRSTDGLAGEKISRALALVLPNLLKEYAPDGPVERIQEGLGYRAGRAFGGLPVDLVLDLDRVVISPVTGKQSGTARPTEVVTIFAKPVALRFFNADGTRADLQQTYDVASLDPDQIAAAPVVTQAAATDQPPLQLTAETADLLIAKYLPEAIDAAAIDRMLLGRWHYEASFNKGPEEPSWGRFFVEGSLKPNAHKRAELAASFRKWTRQRAAAMPGIVTLKFTDTGLRKQGPLRLGYPRAGDLAGQRPKQIVKECSRSVSKAPDRVLAATLQSACSYLKAAAELPDPAVFIGDPRYVGRQMATGLVAPETGTGPRRKCQRFDKRSDSYCRGIHQELRDGELFGVDYALDDVLTVDKQIMVPEDRALAATSGLGVRVDVDVITIRRDNKLPLHPFHAAFDAYNDLYREAKLSGTGAPVPRRIENKTADLFVFETRIREARVVNEKTGKTVLVLPLTDLPQPDTSVLVVAEPKPVAAPAAAYGPDVTGLQLGMTMAEADKRIRARMDVGQTLVADRAWQADAATGDIKPYTSGRLYESADGRELIIVYNEPPAAPDTVTGVLRQLSLPKGQVPPARLFDRLREKYGSPAKTRGSDSFWTEGDARCDTLTNAGGADIWRTESGATPVDAAASLAAGKQPRSGRYNGMAPRIVHNDSAIRRGNDCQVGLAASYDNRKVKDWDRLVVRLFDNSTYGELFDESKRLVAAGASVSSASAEHTGAKSAGPALDLDL